MFQKRSSCHLVKENAQGTHESLPVKPQGPLGTLALAKPVPIAHLLLEIESQANRGYEVSLLGWKS